MKATCTAAQVSKPAERLFDKVQLNFASPCDIQLTVLKLEQSGTLAKKTDRNINSDQLSSSFCMRNLPDLGACPPSVFFSS
jgi:hypothetical protein